MTASWTVPLFVAGLVAVFVLTGAVSVAVYVALVAVMLAMIMTREAPLAWRRLVRRAFGGGA